MYGLCDISALKNEPITNHEYMGIINMIQDGACFNLCVWAIQPAL